MIGVDDARAWIVGLGARLGAKGFVVAAEGNLSIRLDDQVLITPTGKHKDMLRPEHPWVR